MAISLSPIGQTSMKSDTEEGEKGDDQVTCHVPPTCPPVGKRGPRLPSRALHETSPSEPIPAVDLPDPVVGPTHSQLIWAVHFVNKPTGPGGDLTMGPTPPAHLDRQMGRGDQSGPHQLPSMFPSFSVDPTECGDPRVCPLESIPAGFVVTL